MSGYETPFQKYLLTGGIIMVLIFAGFANYMRDVIALENAEKEAFKRFKKIEKVTDDIYIPQMKVAGPNGKLVDLLDDDYYTILNIWATWCSPCVKELPALKALKKIVSYEKKWRVIAVSVDSPKDIEKLSKMVDRLKVKDFAGYYDVNKKLQRAVNIKGLPMTLILNKNGKVLYRVYGDALWFEESIVTLLRHI